jgi:uncharacterized protein (DUF983 family)
VLGIALVIELLYEPPIQVHLAIFLPTTAAICIGLLRPPKGVSIALQHRNTAAAGRLEA